MIIQQARRSTRKKSTASFVASLLMAEKTMQFKALTIGENIVPTNARKLRQGEE